MTFLSEVRKELRVRPWRRRRRRRANNSVVCNKQITGERWREGQTRDGDNKVEETL